MGEAGETPMGSASGMASTSISVGSPRVSAAGRTVLAGSTGKTPATLAPSRQCFMASSLRPSLSYRLPSKAWMRTSLRIFMLRSR